MEYPICATGLSPGDFYLFSRLKEDVKGNNCNNSKAMDAVDAFLDEPKKKKG